MVPLGYVDCIVSRGCPDWVLGGPAQMALYAARAAQEYCDRWQIETSFFVMKQEFALEKARVRTLDFPEIKSNPK